LLNLVLVTYDDMPLIEKCISSVIDYVDGIIAVDGIFKDFPHNNGEPGYSTDGTLKYLSSLDKEVALIVMPDLEEVEKRNQYLIGQEGDWYLHLDADEWVENPEVLSELPDTDVLFCPMLREGDGALHYYPRVFKHVEGLHYEGLHYHLVDGSSSLYADIHHVGDDYRIERFPLMIKHNRDGRDPERLKRKAIYYKTLTTREKQVKELLRYG
jgi:hypothetical protein